MLQGAAQLVIHRPVEKACGMVPMYGEDAQLGRPFTQLQEMDIARGGSAWAPATSAGRAKKYPAIGRTASEKLWNKWRRTMGQQQPTCCGSGQQQLQHSFGDSICVGDLPFGTNSAYFKLVGCQGFQTGEGKPGQ